MDIKPAAPLPPPARLGFVLYRAGLAVARAYERALEPLGAAPAEAGVLSALAYSGPAHVRGLARLLGLGRQTIVNVTRRLEEGGLVRRSASDADARLQIFAITSLGTRRLHQIEKIAATFDGALREIVGSDAEPALLRHLGRLLDAPGFAHEE